MPFPRSTCPEVTAPARVSMAACWVACPVPPFAIDTGALITAALPSPRLVLADAADATSDRLFAAWSIPDSPAAVTTW